MQVSKQKKILIKGRRKEKEGKKQGRQNQQLGQQWKFMRAKNNMKSTESENAEEGDKE